MADGEQGWDDLAAIIMATVKADRSSGEVKKLSHRVLSGMAKLAAGGHVLAAAPYGYKIEYETVELPGKPPKTRPVKLVSDPARARHVTWLFSTYAAGGRTLDSLCKELNARNALPPAGNGGRRPKYGPKGPPRWTRYVVRTILRNPRYTGCQVWNCRTRSKYHTLAEGGRLEVKSRHGEGSKPLQREPFNDRSAWVVVPNAHEPLTDQKTFDAVQARLADHSHSGRGSNLGAYLFSGLGVCLHCGRSLKGASKGGRRYYICAAYDAAGVKVCQYGTIREDVLLAKLLEVMKQTFLDPDHRSDLLARARAKLEREVRPETLEPLRRQLAKLETDIAHGNRNLLLLPPERVAVAVETLKAWEAERDRLREELNEREHGSPVTDLEATFRAVEEWLGQLEELVKRGAKLGTLPRLRDAIRAGLARFAVRWEHRRMKKRVRHDLADGVFHLWDARGVVKQVSWGKHGWPSTRHTNRQAPWLLMNL